MEEPRYTLRIYIRHNHKPVTLSLLTKRDNEDFHRNEKYCNFSVQLSERKKTDPYRWRREKKEEELGTKDVKVVIRELG